MARCFRATLTSFIFIISSLSLTCSFYIASNVARSTARFSHDMGRHSIRLKSKVNNWIESFLILQQPKGVSLQYIRSLVEKQNLTNFTVVLTGACGGIGSAIVDVVLALDGNVVAIDFDDEALMLLQQKNPGKIITYVSDFRDLESVSLVAQSISDKVSRVDILVNNAGICYLLEDTELEKAGASKQGYDNCFQINYLSHFLLTEKLLDKIDPLNGRVVQVTSGMSWCVDGKALIPSNGKCHDPAASRSDDTRLQRHISAAYGNTKLAQIWHAAMLNKSGRATVVCACPSWAATSIAGRNTDEMATLEKLAFSTRPQNNEEIAGPGIRSTLNAMFLPRTDMSPELLSCEQSIGNSKVLGWIFTGNNKPNPVLTSDIVVTYGREKLVKLVASVIVLIFQRWAHEDFILQDNSFESLNQKGQVKLYEWSLRAIQAYR